MFILSNEKIHGQKNTVDNFTKRVLFFVFVSFDSLHHTNNLSVIKGRVFMG